MPVLPGKQAGDDRRIAGAAIAKDCAQRFAVGSHSLKERRVSTDDFPAHGIDEEVEDETGHGLFLKGRRADSWGCCTAPATY